MKITRRDCLVAGLAGLLVACAPAGDQAVARRTNELLQDHLKNETIELTRLSAGQQVTVPTVLSVDGSTEGPCLSLAFSRQDFDERFIRNLFYSSNAKSLYQLSPFAEPGIEAILTSDRVIFNLYAGVVIHLQHSLIYPGGITPFRSQQVKADVVKVIGHAVSSSAKAPPEALKTFLYLRDGKAFALQSRDDKKTREKPQDVNDALARLSLGFAPVASD
jgi:hypothetical protein